MKMKKVLTGSALSLALLVSAAPAFATAASATSNTVSVEKEQKVITPQAYLKEFLLLDIHLDGAFLTKQFSWE